ncbi:hypothetical protein [Bradyrhizobium valentinum]|uniref:hypothetical protein n=1 Tax=Bradyrhizobium valentinum TaxID=1518501 RepID=UPI0012E3DDDB|nr:hypothetical protein [Bradyrhizobium valentinum]
MADTERVNIDGGDEDVRKLNSFLIDPVGIAAIWFLTVIVGSHDTTKEQRCKTFRPGPVNDGIGYRTSLCRNNNQTVLAQRS